MVFRVVLTALIVVSGAAAANAAVISSIDGRASANRGFGFKAVNVGSQLQAGDRVLVAQGSSATVSFYEDCEITVYAGETYRIPEDPQCQPGGGYFPIARPGLVFLGAATVIGAAAIIAATQGSDNDPPREVSP